MDHDARIAEARSRFVRPIKGHVSERNPADTVEVHHSGIVCVVTGEFYKPDEARELAYEILAAADSADAIPVKWPSPTAVLREES